MALTSTTGPAPVTKWMSPGVRCLSLPTYDKIIQRSTKTNGTITQEKTFDIAQAPTSVAYHGHYFEPCSLSAVSQPPPASPRLRRVWHLPWPRHPCHQRPGQALELRRPALLHSARRMIYCGYDETRTPSAAIPTQHAARRSWRDHLLCLVGRHALHLLPLAAG